MSVVLSMFGSTHGITLVMEDSLLRTCGIIILCEYYLHVFEYDFWKDW